VFRVGATHVVVTWLVIQMVKLIFPAFGFGDGAERILTIFFCNCLIPILIFVWAFEITPEGLKKESEVDRSQSMTPHKVTRNSGNRPLETAAGPGYSPNAMCG